MNKKIIMNQGKKKKKIFDTLFWRTNK